MTLALYNTNKYKYSHVHQHPAQPLYSPPAGPTPIMDPEAGTRRSGLRRKPKVDYSEYFEFASRSNVIFENLSDVLLKTFSNANL